MDGDPGSLTVHGGSAVAYGRMDTRPELKMVPPDIQLEPERHSLYYVYTALSQPVSAPGIYEYTAMGLLDDRKIDYYNSIGKVRKPQQDWMNKTKVLPADYWEKGTQSRKSKEQWFILALNILMERMRHNASDIHSLMWRVGCEAVKRPDGTLQFVKGVDEYSYDGRDFLSFDDNSMQWVAPVNAALQTKRTWDDVPILNQYTKGYLEKECVEWLDKFQPYADKELAETLKEHPPKVYLFAKNGRPHGKYQLTCLATGFYPKDMTISILKKDWPEKDGHPSDVLPNGDETHQIRVTFPLETMEIHMYRCKVEHRTLPEPIIAEWKEGDASLHGGVEQVQNAKLHLTQHQSLPGRCGLDAVPGVLQLAAAGKDGVQFGLQFGQRVVQLQQEGALVTDVAPQLDVLSLRLAVCSRPLLQQLVPSGQKGVEASNYLDGRFPGVGEAKGLRIYAGSQNPQFRAIKCGEQLRSTLISMSRVTLFTISTFLLACLADIQVEPGRHSLYYVYTALSQPVSAPGIYEFTAMGLLDDRKIDYYNSEKKVKVPEQDWMKAKLPADYWEKGTASRKSKEQWFKVNVNILMERMRHNTSDVHSLMWRHGCEAVKTQDGSLKFVKGVDEYSYDGSDFLSFDDNSMQWVAPVNAALQTKRKWDDVPILNQYTKGYLEKECVEWLDKFRSYGDRELTESQKQHPPKVHLFARNGRPHGRDLLTCLATGFYPKDIKISILKNDWPEKDGHPSDVLPNGDGTHQIRVTIIAEKEEIHMHRCKVEHRTLDKPIIVEWETEGKLLEDPCPGSDSGPPIGAIVGALAVLLIAAGLVILAKMRNMLCFGGGCQNQQRVTYKVKTSDRIHFARPRMGPGTLFVVCAIVSTCFADIQLEPEKHSLYYVYTALSQPVSAPGIFEFTAMGLLDDRKIDYYNSEDKIKKPEQDWMKAKLPADYWEKGTQSRKSKEQWFKVNVNILMERMRHNASDIHSLMWRHGCEAVKGRDGTLQFYKGVDEYSYDGSDFLSFDDNSMQWVAPVTEAFQTKRKWDDVPILNQYTKGYLEKECVEWLDKFRTYRDSELTESQKHYPPKVYLFAKNGRPHGKYQLTCLVTGFYPKDMKISILKNDWPEKESHERDVLPNGDGTHQIRVTIIVEKVEINMYRCKVDDRTLDNPIIAEWEKGDKIFLGYGWQFFVKFGVPPPEDAKSFPSEAVGGVAVLVILAALGLAVLFVAKKKEKLCFAPPPPPDPPVPEGQRDDEGAPMLPVVANQDGGPPGEVENVKVEDDQKGTERKDSDGGDSGKGGSPPGSVTGQLQEANGNHASASRETLEAAVNGDENQQGEGTSSNGSSDGSTENIQEANGNHASASRETLEAAVNGDENQQGTGSDTDDTGKGTSSNGSSDGSTENIQA
ncbi:uncharacterized protein LOC134436081 [Engraulis encrasicolus]|uniref:uncharacterized protein LOC134436081 n=1 Tax=Engraulis encrasicolus TaxID=184585 RepID=UPI002FD21EA3